MNVQQKTWGIVTDLLREARTELARAPAGSCERGTTGQSRAAQFEMFIDANELELAWDTLADLANGFSSARFWEKMLISAALISLAPQANLAATRLCNLSVHTDQS